MAIPIRFAPVLEGQEAVEFYGRWHQSLEEPLKCPQSQEVREELEQFIRKQAIHELNKGL
ncbi:MAG: hypothetical protein FWH18_11350 [Marinilabiliaceae bacterium]|nr:hypothetical protein [Marinilabiliaceae bacterium]